MTNCDNRLIYDGLKRRDAILFLVSQGFSGAKLRRKSDDYIAFLYDTYKRMEGEQ